MLAHSGLVAPCLSGKRDPNSSAALLEQLQLFEMEHEGKPSVVARVLKRIAEDPSFEAALEAGLVSGQVQLPLPRPCGACCVCMCT